MITPMRGSMGAMGVSQGGAVAIPWWLTGGIAAGDCVGAYLAKGAASLAASYVNLANPGTDATPLTPPTLGANGWDCNGTQGLDTGIVPDNLGIGSMIIRFIGGTLTGDHSLCGVIQNFSGSDFNLWCATGGYAYVANGSYGVFSSPLIASGTYAMAGRNMFKNGTPDGTIPFSVIVTSRTIYIGGVNYGSFQYGFIGTIVGLALYRADVSAQMPSVHTALMAL